MSVLDLFFPKHVKCMFCSSETKVCGICEDCYKNLSFIKGKTCSKCGTSITGNSLVCIECKGRSHSFDRSFAVLDYKDEVQKKIISFKQNGYKYIGENFAWLIKEKFDSLNLDVDIIIPVPINENRLKERGFNQSEVLCKELLETGKVDCNTFIRIVDTPHQTGLSRENRELNLQDCFSVVDKKKVKGKNILLVDDIYTTGSTLSECAKTLRKAGANKVFALCLARAVVESKRVLDKN